jgi:SNF2 family DNA or RNA helicase
VYQSTIQFGDDNEHATTYEHLYIVARSIFSKQLNQEVGSRSIKDIWPLLIRLKQACCHAGLVPMEVRERAARAYAIRDESDDPAQMLAIMKPVVVVERDDTSGDQKNDDDEMSDDVDEEPIAVAEMDPRSPKVEALLKSILDMKPDEKAVIFSQFTGFLNIVAVALDVENHTHTRIDGTMTSQKRQTAMEMFSADACDLPDTPRFILCSLKACGVGITLTRASNVFMVRAGRQKHSIQELIAL